MPELMVQSMPDEMATLTGVPIYHRPSKKITKSRSKMVTPILKKVIPQSPKNSLDLDRGWDDQTADFRTGGIYESESTSMSPSARDVTFPVTPWEPSGYSSSGVVGGVSGRVTPVGGIESTAAAAAAAAPTVAPRSSINLRRGRFQHARTSSGHSHVSITTTSGSCHRPGASFVHPFQQMPRTNTPPLTYANSFTSFERDSMPRDYSPTVITENDDDEQLALHSSTSLTHQPLSSHLHRAYHTNNSHSTISLRRQSFASQRTSSLTDLNNNVNVVSAPLRVNTAPIRRSHPAAPTSTPRVTSTSTSTTTHGDLNTSFSQSDLQLESNPPDSPRQSLTLASPTTSVAPMSPVRSSFEGAFRLRSRSEIDTGARREDIREARRKFEEKERAKQEKYESDQRRKMERKDSKLEKTNSIIGRPSFSRKRTPPMTAANTNNNNSRPAKSVELLRPDTIDEKVGQRPGSAFMSSNYESTEGGEVPSFGPDVADVRFETPKRASGAKRRTQSYWTSFMLWLRTRLLKMGRR